MKQDSPGSVLTRARTAVKRRLRTRVKYLYRLPAGPREPGTAGFPFRLEPGTPDNLDRLHRENPSEINERKHRILLERAQDPGEDVWVIVDDQGQQCGFTGLAWVDHLMRKEDHVIRVRPHQALLVDDYVLIAQRRRGAQSYSVLRRLEIAAERGRSEVILAIDRTNTASQGTFNKLGATTIGRIVTFRHFKRSVQLERLSPERWGRAARTGDGGTAEERRGG